jgi:hypothetical protein
VRNLDASVGQERIRPRFDLKRQFSTPTLILLWVLGTAWPQRSTAFFHKRQKLPPVSSGTTDLSPWNLVYGHQQHEILSAG